MRYRILIDEAAEDDYRGLSPEMRERVKQRVFALGTDPLPGNARQLSGDLRGLCRIRLGDYRLVYELDMPARTVTIIVIAHRSHVYDMARRRRPG